MTPADEPSHTHCITCSDEGIPMRVVRTDTDGIAACVDPEATDGSDAAEQDVMVDLVEPVTEGDILLVHAGVALMRVSGPAARETAST